MRPATGMVSQRGAGLAATWEKGGWMACGGDAEYELMKIVGRGSFGHVATGARRRDGYRVAVKRVTHVFDSRRDCLCILREIRILSSLPQHPNIVKLNDVRTMLGPAATSDADIFLVFEQMPTDLEKVVASNQFFTPEHVRWLTLDLLRALRVLHSAGIVHRDLKPANMLLEIQPVRLKVCDFGLARALPKPDAVLPLVGDEPRKCAPAASAALQHSPAAKPGPIRRQLTQHVVTRWYRAPELLLRTELYNTAVDMWAVGCIFAELLSMEEASVPCHLDRSPLFPGVSSDMTPNGDLTGAADQIEAIVRVVGSPTADEVEAIVSRVDPRASQRLSAMDHHAPADLRALFPGAEHAAICALRRLLVFDPRRRMTVDEAIEHEYVSAIRSSADDAVDDASATVIDLAIDDSRSLCSAVELRALIQAEVSRCRQADAAKPKGPTLRRSRSTPPPPIAPAAPAAPAAENAPAPEPPAKRRKAAD